MRTKKNILGNFMVLKFERWIKKDQAKVQMYKDRIKLYKKQIKKIKKEMR